MPAPTTLTIVFRGLMVFHEDKTSGLMEIGILNEPAHHIPRILTLKNGVLAAVRDLRGRPEKSPWKIKLKKPGGAGIKTRKRGPDKFVRATHEFDDDFRWIMDLEGEEFYKRDLTRELDTSPLTRVLNVEHGEFYTRLRSPRLNRSSDHDPAKPFGEVSAVMGCDMADNGEGAELVAPDGAMIFAFKNEPNTMYEIANTPPDIVGNGHPGMITNHDRRSGANNGPDDHFQHYYELFKPNKPKPIFHLEPPDSTPDPDPAVCGLIMLGQRVGSISK